MGMYFLKKFTFIKNEVNGNIGKLKLKAKCLLIVVLSIFI